MCQLLGMNCAKLTDFTFSFTGFAKRGGETDIHQDGWGLVFYEGRGIRAFHDSLPASQSPIANLVSNYPTCKTLNMISHIRYATSGACLLENVHPFQREIWGIPFVFAHNGDVPEFSHSNSRSRQIRLGRNRQCKEGDDFIFYYTPVGTTDSEAIFCAMLNEMRNAFEFPPSFSVLYTFLNEICMEIVKGDELDNCIIFNFLLSCGEKSLFAFSWPGSRPGSNVWNGLYYIVRKHPFQMATLKDCDVVVDFSKVTTIDDCVAVTATTPLTKDETWIEFKRGELLLFQKGKPLSSAKECELADDLI